MGEAYLPVLDALGRLCRGARQERLQVLLSQYAPTWLLQMPALLHEAYLEAWQRRAMGASQERMLRELAETVAMCEASGRGALLAETYRLQGALLLRQADAGQAEACVQQGLSVARRQ